MTLLILTDADHAVGNLTSAVVSGQHPREALLVANTLMNLGHAAAVAVRVACTPPTLTRPVLLRSQPITAGDSASDKEVSDATAPGKPGQATTNQGGAGRRAETDHTVTYSQPVVTAPCPSART